MNRLSWLFASRGLPIKRQDLVLDIGSGDNPHVRADVLCDRFVFDSGERNSRFDLVIDGRPFIVADACSIPVMDKSFDFVICRHLLEHMTDPEALLREIMRVGKPGYIETPSPLMERLHGWDFHRLLVGLDGSTLVIQPKSPAETYGLLPDRLLQSRAWLRLRDTAAADLVTTKLVWRDSIDYRCIGDISGEPCAHNGTALERLPPQSWRRRLRWLVTRGMRLTLTRHGNVDISKMLMCADCRVRMAGGARGVVCPSCRRSYRIIRGNVVAAEDHAASAQAS